MTITSALPNSGARRRPFMEGRSAERLADEIRQQEIAHTRAMRKAAGPSGPGARARRPTTLYRRLR